jgi:hypothetical protein
MKSGQNTQHRVSEHRYAVKSRNSTKLPPIVLGEAQETSNLPGQESGRDPNHHQGAVPPKVTKISSITPLQTGGRHLTTSNANPALLSTDAKELPFL